jgi:hypothetical protein
MSNEYAGEYLSIRHGRDDRCGNVKVTAETYGIRELKVSVHARLRKLDFDAPRLPFDSHEFRFAACGSFAPQSTIINLFVTNSAKMTLIMRNGGVRAER